MMIGPKHFARQTIDDLDRKLYGIRIEVIEAMQWMIVWTFDLMFVD